MAAYYEHSVPISRLSARLDFVSSDILLVSEYNPESDSLHYTDRTEAGRYGELISAQFDIQGMKDETFETSVRISAVSADYVRLREDLDGLSAAFLSNDELTRGIPGLSAGEDELSARALATLRYERMLNLKPGDDGKFRLSSFAVNTCRPTGSVLVKFVLPPEISGLSRHFTVRVSSDVDFIPAFYGNALFFAEKPFNEICKAGKEMYYDFKEIRQNCFYFRFGVPGKPYVPPSPPG